jgi:hypothetical protein
MNMRSGPSLFTAAGSFWRRGLASLTLLVVGANNVWAQGLPPGAPPGAGGPPPGFNGPAPQTATVEPPRPGGLRIGPRGFTVGDAGGLDKELVRNGAVPPLAPPAPDALPPNPDPRDFSGSWHGDQYLEAFEILKDMYGNPVPFNQRGQQVMDRRLIVQDNQEPYITPAIVCRPSGPVWDLIRIQFRVFQSQDKIEVFSDADRAWWQIPLNPSMALPPGTRSYMGRSIGHWESNTLVVETTDFKTRQWLSFRGTPLSPTGKLTQRIRKVYEDRWFLEIVHTVDDPVHYTRPWSFVRTFSWRPDFGLPGEYDCEEQSGDKDNASATAGFVPEPED